MLSSASSSSESVTTELESNIVSQRSDEKRIAIADNERSVAAHFRNCVETSYAAEAASDAGVSSSHANVRGKTPLSNVVTDLVSPPAPVAIVFDGIHVVEPLFDTKKNRIEGASMSRQLSGRDAGENSGALDDSIHLEESDGDVLERGIVVSSPAFTYVYEDALCGNGIVDDPPPISLGAAAVSSILQSQMEEGRADVLHVDNGVNDGSFCSPSEVHGTSTYDTPASLQLQYLGPASTLEPLDNAVVLNVRALDNERKTKPLIGQETQARSWPKENARTDSNAEHLDRGQPAINSAIGGLPLQDSQRVSPASRARLVVKRPLLSGDDEFELNNQACLQQEIDARLRLPLGMPSSGSFSSKSSANSNGVFGDPESNEEKEKGNNVILQLDEYGKLVKPTEPAKALSLAFRTLHRRQSSLNRSRSFNSSNELQTICELKPSVLGHDPVPADSSQDVSSTSGGNGTTWQVQASITARPDAIDAKPPRFHPSKEPQPQGGEVGMGIPTMSRTSSAEDRLLQEATQYAEALGERPPRSMDEISRQIIDDDYDQFASDDDDEAGVSIDGTSHDEDTLLHEEDATLSVEQTDVQAKELDGERGNSSHTEQLLPPGTPESKMVEELLTATHGGHNLPKSVPEVNEGEVKPETNISGVKEENHDLVQNDQIKIVFERQLSYQARRGKSDEFESRSRTDSSDSIERWKEKHLEIDKRQQLKASLPSMDLFADIGQENMSSRIQAGSRTESTGQNFNALFPHSDQPTSKISASRPLTQQSASLKHRSSHGMFGKYMLNPRPFGSDGKPPEDVGYIYQGIKFNPPEITKRGTQRGNFAQLHRKAWLEVSDKYHRYGKNLRLYYKEWERLGHPYQMFFDWLDSKGEAAGEPLPNLPECPRMQLDRDTVLYINDPDVQESYRLTLSVVCKGETDGEVPDRRCVVLDCNDEPVSTGPDGWIFVLRDNCFYGARKVTEAVPTQSIAAGSEGNSQSNSTHSHRESLTRMGSGVGNANAIKKRFHHSSFFAGRAVTAAGIFITDEAGKLKCMYPHSGHYRPGEAHMQRLLYFVQRLGIDLNSFEVDVQQIAHVARKEKVVLQQVIVSPTQKGGEESQQQSCQPSGDKGTDLNSNMSSDDGKIVKIRSKKEKCKKTDSVHLRSALHVAWFLTHKAKMLSKGVFGMIQNIRQVRAVSVQEALDAVDNGGYYLKSRIKRDHVSNHSHSHSDEMAAVALLQHHRQKSNSQSPDLRERSHVII